MHYFSASSSSNSAVFATSLDMFRCRPIVIVGCMCSIVIRCQADLLFSNGSLYNNNFIFQLEEAKSQANSAITRLKEVEAELAALTDRCEQQAKDLFKKSSVYMFPDYNIYYSTIFILLSFKCR